MNTPDAEKRRFDLSQVGMDPVQVSVFKTMLQMLQRRTIAEWNITEGDFSKNTPGLLIVNADDPQGAEVLARLANYPDGRIAGKVVAVLQGEAGGRVMPANTLKLDSPLRVMNFLDVLNAAANMLVEGVTQNSTVKPSASAMPKMSSTSPFLTALHDVAQRTEGVFQVNVGQAKAIFFVAEKRVFFEDTLLDLAQLGQSTSTAAVNTTALNISDAEAQNAIVLSKPWDAFLWMAGLSAGQGSLLPWLEGDCTYRLRRWPESSLLTRRAAHVRLAAHFSKELVTPVAVAHTSSSSISDVVDFVNACSLCGYLIVGKRMVAEVSAPAVRNVEESGGKRSLFGRIRSKLGL